MNLGKNLKRSRVIAAMQMYGSGQIDAHVTELIKKDKFHHLFETEVGRQLIKNSCLKEKYHEVQNREFSSGYQNAVTSKLVKNILDPCFHILGADDKLLRELLDNTKVGIIVQYCEHDVIRDDSLILLERLRNLKSDKLVEEVRAVGGVHAMFQICTYLKGMLKYKIEFFCNFDFFKYLFMAYQKKHHSHVILVGKC